MTIEKRLFVTLNEIKTIRIVCKCGASIHYTPHLGYTIPPTCLNCREEWGISNPTERELLDRFMGALANLRERMQSKNYTIQIEFEQPA